MDGAQENTGVAYRIQTNDHQDLMATSSGELSREEVVFGNCLDAFRKGHGFTFLQKKSMPTRSFNRHAKVAVELPNCYLSRQYQAAAGRNEQSGAAPVVCTSVAGWMHRRELGIELARSISERGCWNVRDTMFIGIEEIIVLREAGAAVESGE